MKKFLSVALASAIALTPSVSSANYANVAFRFFWYADEVSSTVVGEYIVFCDAPSYQWGEATAYPGETEVYDC
jgi:predicted cobalt transporter CbtA